MKTSVHFPALARALFFGVPPLLTIWAASPLHAEHETGSKPGSTATDPMWIAPASNEAELALKGFRPAPGLQVELWAAEPLLANPVAFHFDDQGRAYVVETFRLHHGVTDIRNHMNWLDDDLAARTVADRLAMMRKFEGPAITNYSRFPDRVRRVVDQNGDGKADVSTVFSDGYSDVADGLAAGVLTYKDNVLFANIPHLWQLKDTNQDGVADQKSSLMEGFGVRVGFLGHDLHGLILGPDGRIYFSIGDRGAEVVTQDGRKASNPDTGAVYRCNPDGTELEIFASGLRNPQELAFDDFGNLFTGDNNSDGGDPARWVYLVEGGDSGWRIGWQFIEEPNLRGAWISEKMCYPQNSSQPAYFIPPIANIGNGPSGLAYYPGTGLPESYRGHFFLVDFTGSKNSGVHTFGLTPKGAGFEMVKRDKFIWDVLATDIEFGPDGGVYVSDWVQGWDQPGKGRIYRVFDPAQKTNPALAEVKTLLKEGFDHRAPQALAGWLAHADQRIRLRAQWALADKGAAGQDAFVQILKKSQATLPRLHALWGLGQLLRKESDSRHLRRLSAPVVAVLRDDDPEVRAQAAKVLGESSVKSAAPSVVPLLQDAHARVRFFAAQALAHIGTGKQVPHLVKLASSIGDDVYLRHVTTFALRRLASEGQLLDLRRDSSPSVRLVAMLALARQGHAQTAQFLQDPDPTIVLETARAIYDLGLFDAYPALAALVSNNTAPEPLLRRAALANFRLGGEAQIRALAAFIQNEHAPSKVRAEALQMFTQWSKPSGRDRITGLWRPMTPRDSAPAQAALQPAMPALIATATDDLQVQAVRLSAAWKLSSSDMGAALLARILDEKEASKVRTESLLALSAIQDSRLPQAMEAAQKSKDEGLRKESTRLASQQGGDAALAAVRRSLESGTLGEKQGALAALGKVQGESADQLLLDWLNRVTDKQVPAGLVLDVLEAAGKRSSASIKSKLASFESTRVKEDTLSGYRECLEGGDAEAGKKVFLERADVSCVRCHKAHGEGGEVGPELTGIGTRTNREYILDSIVHPNSKIAPGYETVLVTMKDGNSYAGLVKKETNETLDLNSPEDGLITLKKADIATRARGMSGMPEELRTLLSKQDLRNLVEFLATLK